MSKRYLSMFYGGMVLILVFVLSIGTVYAKPVSKANEPIKIGFFGAMTGGWALSGLQTKAAAEYYCAKINASGGILGRSVQPLIRDTKMKPSEALRACKDLVINEGCKFISGGKSSGTASACARYVQSQKGRALISIYPAVASSITEEHGGRYITRIATNTIGFSRALARYAAKRWGKTDKRLFLLAANFSYPREFYPQFKQAYAELVPDAKWVGEAWPKLGTSDYTPYITTALAAKPDMILSVLFGVDLINFTKQAEPFGLLEKVHFVDGHNDPHEDYAKFKRGDAGIALKGYFPAAWPFYSPELANNPRTGEIVNGHLKYGNVYPGSQSCYVAPYLDLLKGAMEKAGTTTDLEAIIDSMLGLTVDTVVGKVTMRACDGQNMWPVWVGRLDWDPTGKFKFPILVDLERFEPDQLYHTCEEVATIRAKSRK